MKHTCLATILALLLAACGGGETPPPMPAEPAAITDIDVTTLASEEIVPGLSKRLLRAGEGGGAQPGDFLAMQYTGWLHDPAAPNFRGEQFDSSYDHGAPFRFRLGEGRVIRGWDEGIVGMQVGEARELTIAPDLGYGARGFADVIPPDSTLVFIVELEGNEGLDSRSEP